MRKKIVAGNWKMNLTLAEANELLNELNQQENNKPADVEIIIHPPFVYLAKFAEQLSNSTISLGAQNCSSYTSGAYTGEIAAQMIASCGVKYVIIGHSERRSMFGDTNTIIAEKINQALNAGLTPIFCCGELLSERENNEHFKIVEQQLNEGIFHLSEEQFSKCIIAYEPVWAIGTGKTATPQQAQEMHQFIRKQIASNYTEKLAQSCSILYGGSCNANNAQELFAQTDIDGGLIGGASLKANDFFSIANAF